MFCMYIGKMYISKTRLVTRHSTLVAFCDIADKTESYKGAANLSVFNLSVLLVGHNANDKRRDLKVELDLKTVQNN